MKKKYLILLLSLSIVLVLTACGFSSTADGEETIYSYGDSFTFDDLQITINTQPDFTTVDNEYSDYYESNIIRIEATVKNLRSSSHHLNMFDFKYFAPNENELKKADIYFDDGLEYAGDLSSGASYTKAFYIPYTNDGTYKILFDDILTKDVVVELPVTIGDNSIANSKTEYLIGEKFRYHFFEITGEDISFTSIDNQFSSYYGKDIIRVPLTLKNLSEKSQHLNTYSCTVFNFEGVEVDTVDTYFDDSLGWGAKDIASGALYTGAFYIVYTGDGEYTIEFGTKVKLVIDVKK